MGRCTPRASELELNPNSSWRARGILHSGFSNGDGGGGEATQNGLDHTEPALACVWNEHGHKHSNK